MKWFEFGAPSAKSSTWFMSEAEGASEIFGYLRTPLRGLEWLNHPLKQLEGVTHSLKRNEEVRLTSSDSSRSSKAAALLSSSSDPQGGRFVSLHI